MIMKPMTLEQIARAADGVYVGQEAARGTCITGVVSDSRAVQPGNLFLCIPGARADGHDFAPAAYAAGAACCLAERPLENAAGPYILVRSVLEAVQGVAAFYRSLFTIPVIGIIGSVGKTTAKEMTAAVLTEKYATLKTEANLNNELGVPLTLLRLREAHEAAVVEMGISDFGEMTRLARMVRPDLVVMTAIGHCHLETLGDLDGVLRAKSEVFAFMRPDALAVVNGDDEKLAGLEPGVRKLTYGFGAGNPYRAEDVADRGTEGISCRICTPGSSFPAHIPGFGRHLVLAALAAAAVGRELGVTDVQIAAGLGRYAAVGGRANVIETGRLRVINDCYNANPNSMSASLRSLAGLAGRRVAVLGDMKELGQASAELHRGIGRLAAELEIDLLLITGPEAEAICAGAREAGMQNAVYFPDKAALEAALPGLLADGDSVLVKASHGMHFETIVDVLRGLGA